MIPTKSATHEGESPRPTSLVALPTSAPQCDGVYHALGTYGHDHGPARFRVNTRCACGFLDTRLICAGRAADIKNRPAACEKCGVVASWWGELLTLEELEVLQTPTLTAVPADVFGAFEFALRAQGFAETTIKNRVAFARSLEHILGKSLLEVTRSELVAQLGRQGIKAASRRAYQVAIQSFFRFCVEQEHRTDNPAASLPSVKVPRGKPRPFTRGQIDQMLNSGAYRKTRAMILLGYYQGFRVSSIARVHGSDIDLASNTIRTVGKGAKERSLPLHPVIAELASVMPTDRYWFPARKAGTEHMSSVSVTNLITLAKKRAGILDPTLTPHSLRHSFATHMIEEGVDVRVIQELMMHGSLGSTQIYLGVSDRLAREGIESLSSMRVPTQSGR
jgi:integrase/recombinase XerD